MKNIYSIVAFSFLVLLSVNLASAVVPGHRGSILLREGVSINMGVLEKFCSADSCVIDESESYKSILFKMSDESNRESGFSVSYDKIGDRYSIYVYDNSGGNVEVKSDVFEYVPEGLRLLYKYGVLKGISEEELDEIIDLVGSRTIYFKPESCVDVNSHVFVDSEKSGFSEEMIEEAIEGSTDQGQFGWLSYSRSCGIGLSGYTSGGCPIIEHQLGVACIQGDGIEEVPNYSSLTALSFDEDSDGNSWMYFLYGGIVLVLIIVLFLVFKRKK